MTISQNQSLDKPQPIEQPDLHKGIKTRPMHNDQAITGNKDSALVSNDIKSAPIITGAISPCSKYYLVQQGDTCASVGIKFADLRNLNTSLNEGCTNLWSVYQYCVAV